MRPSFLAAAVLVAFGALRAAAAPGSVSFEVDDRVELLSIVLMLSQPAVKQPDAYAAAAQAAFAQFSRHPAVTHAAALRKNGASASTLAEDDALQGDLRDFEEASRFAVFIAAHKKEHQAYIETARRESLHALSPEAALAYMGIPFEGEHRFVLAPLLPADAGGPRVRPGARDNGVVRFRFDEFETSVAAELCRAAVSWVRAPAGAVPAHVAAAVGLRVIAADLGERVYLNALARHASQRLPHLRAVGERLKDFEKERARYPTLQAFSPRLESIAAIRIEQATLAAHAGERAEALALLTEARTHSPDLETGRRIMFLYQDLKEDGLAKVLSDEILKASPGNAGVLLDQAGLAAKAGERAAALAFLAEAAGKHPHEAARRRMAELYLELKEYGPARDLLDGLISAEPHDPRLRVDRALVAARTGDRATALRLLAEAASRRPSPNERRHMSLLHLELKDHAPAKGLLDRLIKESPSDATLRVDRAALAAAAGDRAGALRRLGEARELSPSLDTRHRIALLYHDLDDDEHGRDLLSELLQSFPQNARLRIDRAAHAARGGDRAAALRYLAEARRLNPSLEERRLMVSLHQGLGDHEQALDLLAGLIAAAPKDPGLRIDRASLALRTGDHDGARLALGTALTLNPEPADRRRMALLHQDMKDYAAALSLLAPLAREQPENAALLGDLGLCEYLNGRPEEAIAHLRAAIKLDASSLPAVLTLGSIFAAQKRFAEERAVYAAAPPAGGAPELRAVLQRSRKEALARAAHE